ncbi:MAG TPA: hypothetical protein VGV14_13095 [Rhodanobacter sp.]|nr:hypothetical protein [Rhodanobacter sp.]
MRRLSSSLTFFYKRVFPVLWVGFVLTVFFLQFWAMQHARADAPSRPFFPLLLMPLFMVGVMFLLYRKLLHDLLDEVWLDGNYLVVKNRGEKIRVALSDVMNVNATTMTNPRRVTLMLRTDSRFGRNLTFMPASPRGFMSAFKPDPIASELIERVDALRGVAR